MDNEELSDAQIERMIKLSYLRMIQNMAAQSQPQSQPEPTFSVTVTLLMDKIMSLENRVNRIEQERRAAVVRPDLGTITDTPIFDALMSVTKPSDFIPMLDALMAASSGTGTAGPGTPIGSIRENISLVLRDFDKWLAHYTDEVSKGDYKSKDAILTMLENVKLEYERIKRVHGLRMGGTGTGAGDKLRK